MEQYLDLLREIKQKGTIKPAARENMPSTCSLFGYQFRHNLQDGFPLLTTKKLSFKNIVYELLWFLRGDTNIKYLVDHGCNIWNEDAYNYYKKIHKKHNVDAGFTFEEFVNHIKIADCKSLNLPQANYRLGDCGKQYGELWRRWKTGQSIVVGHNGNYNEWGEIVIDQIADLISGLRNNPQGRRHILTAWNPATLDDMALNACHALVQFNCRPLSQAEKLERLVKNDKVQKIDMRTFPEGVPVSKSNGMDITYVFDKRDFDSVPKYYLDCQLYQRSADVFLGVPYNIASYALLTEILAKMCNMIPGDFVHSFGDVHIYENHNEGVDEQLNREPKTLPKLYLNTCPELDYKTASIDEVLKSIEGFEENTFQLIGYDPRPSIKAKLSTGLK